ncbi:LEAF RUST 10 DISEASE-RESISTANCE LOCUS RECEPTOR-LIKE PROTEIN KINASE-like 1.2 [Gastrolobium bilobum]|uniref:LEAF RUST 10 DISEASE-RESISTANCE LOCUS RECEPTOR-LIKE PROTEIN KINASE-like 1.2 n=1 Tax=Gastrolobium bilobum TaxID=150636 RepID=UPI002AB2EBEA|nr:LEAF RUST 10 DISEASE-RESISTANCE LOCUS RECEPTOR-LIKE PROTEIN KINASE-like 1.2 [Gastrolobium bilobum]
MAAHSVFGFFFILCYFLFLVTAAAQEAKPEECPESFQCGHEVEFSFPDTINPKCSLPINVCDDNNQIKEIQLKYQPTYTTYIISPDEYNSIFTHYPNFETLSYEASVAIPPGPTITPFPILNNIPFSKCIHISNDKRTHTNISMYRKCPDYAYFPSEHHGDDSENHILPYACLLVQLRTEQVPNSTCPCPFLISFLEIELEKSEFSEDCWFKAPPDKRRDLKATIIGLSIALASVITIALFVILLMYKQRHKSSGVQNQPRNTYPGPFSRTTNPESGAVYFGVPVFSYEELQEATNNFDQARELGEGGFGTVYYGKLRDGREVAVKRLYERNTRPVESFINEIQILTRLRHRNLVSLYGCTSRHSRELLLVYEYIPNGTVSCNLHGDKAKPGLLPWPVRMKIAIETASALTYLHASDIIHRDVKTSNILLDNSFCVKVADFGLSRLFPNDVTHVSTAPRGTPGYVDPDYRICYQLTSKSDVYSFGVVLVELISSLPAVDMNRDKDEIKLAKLAIRKIQKRAFCELVDPSLGFQSDDKLRRMIISVAELAFQCLQGDKELRPSMGEVLEVLQRITSGNDEPGNHEGIDVHGARISQSYVYPSLPNTLEKPQRLHQTL